MELPFDFVNGIDEKDRDFRVVAAQVFLVHVLSRVKIVPENLGAFVRAMDHSRYMHLQPDGTLASELEKRQKPFDCLKSNDSHHAEIIARYEVF